MNYTRRSNRLDKAEDSALRERDYWEETVNRILYTCSSEHEIGEWSSANDPVERFIEQFRPVKRIDPTKSDGCGHLGWLRQEFDKAEKRSAQVPDRAKPKVVRGTVEAALRPDDVELLETDPMEFVRRTQQEPGESLARGLDDLAAGRVSRRDDYLEPQQEPAERRAYLGPYEAPEEFTDGYEVLPDVG